MSTLRSAARACRTHGMSHRLQVIPPMPETVRHPPCPIPRHHRRQTGIPPASVKCAVAAEDYRVVEALALALLPSVGPAHAPAQRCVRLRVVLPPSSHVARYVVASRFVTGPPRRVLFLRAPAPHVFIPARRYVIRPHACSLFPPSGVSNHYASRE